MLTLTFEPVKDLPPSMRREAIEHGWKVAGPDAYPVVKRQEPNGMLRPLVERDIEIATAAARSLRAFFARHSDIFESEAPTPVCESYFDADDREVRLTAPFEAAAHFDPPTSAGPEPADDFAPVAPSAPAEPFRPRAGRNDPCPCGSGRKYKKCHLGPDELAHARNPAANPTHKLDEQLVLRLTRFALDRFGEKWKAFENNFTDAVAAVPLSWPWAVYCFEVDGRTVADAYRAAHGRRLRPEERRWMDAQGAAWLSVWEVEAVDPGKTLTLRDLLSDERRTVWEARASGSLVRRHAVLGRVVDHEGVSLLCGLHPHPLPPFHAAEVVRRARGRLRLRRAVPVERLRNAGFGSYLIQRWEEAVERHDAGTAIPPDLRNRDGDPLLPTVDRFEVKPGAMQAIDDRIKGMEGAEEERPGADPPAWVFVRPDDPSQPEGEGTVVGRVELNATELRVETNSRARADTLRERLEASCGSRIRHRVREHSDPLPLVTRAERPPEPPLAGGGRRGRRVQGPPLRRLGGQTAAGAERQDAARVRADGGGAPEGRLAAEEHGAPGATRPGAVLRLLDHPPRPRPLPALTPAPGRRGVRHRIDRVRRGRRSAPPHRATPRPCPDAESHHSASARDAASRHPVSYVRRQRQFDAYWRDGERPTRIRDRHPSRRNGDAGDQKSAGAGALLPSQSFTSPSGSFRNPSRQPGEPSRTGWQRTFTESPGSM